METLKIDKERTKMVAHRGLSGLEAENTAASFIAAGNKSYYGIECDIRRTKDGMYVVIHDANTNRISDINKVVSESTYEELKQIQLYDLESKITRPHLRVPTLEEYVTICKKYKKKCIIEFKEAFSRDEINEILKIITDLNYLTDCIFISFHVDALVRLRQINTDVKIQYLVGEYIDGIINLCRKYKFDIDINHNILTRELLLEFQKDNILVNAWTIDNPIVALMLIGWGIDYITTNILE